jgi:cytoskeleton protein RodZ
MAATAYSQQDVGRALRRARQRRHVQLEDAASITRIPRRYLEALEDNAPLDSYPAPVYARAFLREYARYLKLDPEPLVVRFGGEGPEEIRLANVRDALPPPRRWPARALLALSIGGLVTLAVVGVLQSRGSDQGLGRFVHPSAPPPVASTVASSPPVPRRPGIKAAIHLIGRSWIRAVADGRVVFARMFDAGHWHVLRSTNDLTLTIGNAGGVRLLLNGKRVRTGADAAVLHLAISFVNGKVRVTRA